MTIGNYLPPKLLKIIETSKKKPKNLFVGNNNYDK